MECLPRRLAVALVAHDDRIAGIEALVEHVSPGEFRADQVPDQFVKLEPIERGHRGRAPPTLEAVFELRVGNEVDARRHLQRRRARELRSASLISLSSSWPQLS